MGTAGRQKMERMFRLAEQRRIPLVLFAEGGGARSGEEAGPRSLKTFCAFASLNGKVPTVGIVSGPCFAANAALVGCCDVVIGTRRASIGMAGPAMIEGGGLGVVRPEEVGPANVQSANGVIDILVEDEAAAIVAAKKYLGFFQGIRQDFECADQRILRHIVPENRKRAYDMRVLIETLADTDTFLELRAGFGRSLITGFVHIEGRPIGICASNPQHLGGAIDSDASDKAARFMQLCDAFGIPILTLIDTPGFMVGPEAERTALVRHTSRLMVIAAHISVPYVSLIVRKCYGLGGLGMNGGDHQRPLVLAAWPTAEHGPMNVEGSVRLGLKRRMAEISDPQERQRLFDEAVAKLYDRGSALSTARRGAIDELIDPAESRAVIVRALRSTDFRGAQGRGSLIDAW
jgi:acetyl-CoA carboxylase carboxyltransferase component